MTEKSGKKAGSNKLVARSALLSLVGNVLLAGVKIISGVVGHSYALIADGIESTLDIFSSLVVMVGVRIGSRPPDAEHPYGHGKAESLAGFVASIGLFIAAVGIGIQSIREILNPHHTPATFTLFVLGGVVIIKYALFRRIKNVGDISGSTALRADAWHHHSDALTSAAAFIGITIAICGGEGYESADDWAALMACGVIVYNGVRMSRMSLAEMMDEVVSEETERRVRERVKMNSGIVDVDKCRIRKSGRSLLIDIHIVVDGEMSVREGHKLAHVIKQDLLHSDMDILDVLVHVEPSDEGVGGNT